MPDGADLQGRVPRVLGQAGLWVHVVLIAVISAMSHHGSRRRIWKREAPAATGPRDRPAPELGAMS